MVLAKWTWDGQLPHAVCTLVTKQRDCTPSPKALHTPGVFSPSLISRAQQGLVHTSLRTICSSHHWGPCHQPPLKGRFGNPPLESESLFQKAENGDRNHSPSGDGGMSWYGRWGAAGSWNLGSSRCCSRHHPAPQGAVCRFVPQWLPLFVYLLAAVFFFYFLFWNNFRLTGNYHSSRVPCTLHQLNQPSVKNY